LAQRGKNGEKKGGGGKGKNSGEKMKNGGKNTLIHGTLHGHVMQHVSAVT
jgi:hypothetical protein